MSAQIEKRYFNAREYYRMVEAGVLSEDDRVELIEGEVLKMSPIGSRHAACVSRLDTLLHHQLGQTAIVRAQSPIHLNDFSEPQPDIALLHPRADFYEQQHPMPEDVLLVIEVADTSVEYDRNIKLPLYARAGLAETWIINLPRNTIEVYTQPLNGKYKKSLKLKRGESFQSQTVPSLSLSVDEILG
jgi:Uma2 family endonuclease